MNTLAARILAGSLVALPVAALIMSIATTASGDVRRCKPIARRELTSAELTNLASIASAHWPAALSSVQGATFKRIAAGGISGILVGCFAGSDAQIAAALAGGRSVENGLICTRETWTLTAGERTTLGSVVAGFWPTLADVDEFHVIKTDSGHAGWASVGETLTDAQALTAAKSSAGLVPGCGP